MSESVESVLNRARALLATQGAPVTSENLNRAMLALAQNAVPEFESTASGRTEPTTTTSERRPATTTARAAASDPVADSIDRTVGDVRLDAGTEVQRRMIQDGTPNIRNAVMSADPNAPTAQDAPANNPDGAPRRSPPARPGADPTNTASGGNIGDAALAAAVPLAMAAMARGRTAGDLGVRLNDAVRSVRQSVPAIEAPGSGTHGVPAVVPNFRDSPAYRGFANAMDQDYRSSLTPGPLPPGTTVIVPPVDQGAQVRGLVDALRSGPRPNNVMQDIFAAGPDRASRVGRGLRSNRNALSRRRQYDNDNE